MPLPPLTPVQPTKQIDQPEIEVNSTEWKLLCRKLENLLNPSFLPQLKLGLRLCVPQQNWGGWDAAVQIHEALNHIATTKKAAGLKIFREELKNLEHEGALDVIRQSSFEWAFYCE